MFLKSCQYTLLYCACSVLSSDDFNFAFNKTRRNLVSSYFCKNQNYQDNNLKRLYHREDDDAAKPKPYNSLEVAKRLRRACYFKNVCLRPLNGTSVMLPNVELIYYSRPNALVEDFP